MRPTTNLQFYLKCYDIIDCKHSHMYSRITQIYLLFIVFNREVDKMKMALETYAKLQLVQACSYAFHLLVFVIGECYGAS